MLLGRFPYDGARSDATSPAAERTESADLEAADGTFAVAVSALDA
jgi:hypothetical protein